MVTFADRVTGFGTTIFTEVNDLISGRDVVNLGQGKPDFEPPSAMRDAVITAIQSGSANQYPPGYGIEPLRVAIAEHAATNYGLTVDPSAGVLVTGGATEGIFSAVLGVVDEGDEVILLEPYYDTYLRAVQIAGGKPVYVPMTPPEWTFDPEKLRAAFSPATRAIIINSPHNPTGRVFSREELTLIAELCNEYDVIAISDEVYEQLTYDVQHVPLATLAGMADRTLTVSSAAKTFNVTGWKVGWVMGAPELITGVWRVHQNVIFAINHPGQVGVIAGLQLGQAYFNDLQMMYAAKRQILLDALASADFDVTYQPQGAFYVLADFSRLFEGDDVAFTKYLIDKVGVACIPPSAFFSESHRHLGQTTVRFAYCKYDEQLLQAAERLAVLRSS